MEIHVGTLIFAVINFCILLFVLRFLLFKPILAALDSRKTEIETSLGMADEAKKKLDEIKLEQARELEAVKAEALAVRASVTKLAEEEKVRIVADARAEASKLIEKAQAQIGEEKERAIATLRSEMASLAISAASKVIGRSLTGADQEALVDQFLKEVSN